MREVKPGVWKVTVSLGPDTRRPGRYREKTQIVHGGKPAWFMVPLDDDAAQGTVGAMLDRWVAHLEVDASHLGNGDEVAATGSVLAEFPVAHRLGADAQPLGQFLLLKPGLHPGASDPVLQAPLGSYRCHGGQPYQIVHSSGIPQTCPGDNFPLTPN